jgi:transcriptional regulator with XRE-family HTH domain
VINLQLLRIQAKLTQKELAARANVRRGDLSYIELGRLNPTAAELARLAQVLGVVVPARLLEHVPSPTWAELPEGSFDRERTEREALSAQGVPA